LKGVFEKTRHKPSGNFLSERKAMQSRAELKHPGLFVIRSVLETVEKAPLHRARFNQLAFRTTDLRNRTSMSQYLKLLVKLGWLSKERIAQRSGAIVKRGRAKSSNANKKSNATYYYEITRKGKDFLSLFK
jgi:predicted transcriptional regulator